MRFLFALFHVLFQVLCDQAGFLGMRGTGDWVTDQRPKNWRETILYLYPNGQVPLTAILSKMDEEVTDDPEFNWWTQKLPEQAGAVTGVYTDSGLSSAYVSGGAAAATLYIKMAEATASEFRIGHQVLLRDASDYRVDVNAKVTARTLNGASSYLTVKLLEADDNSPDNDLSNCDRIMVIGNINPEGGEMPDAIAYDPVKYYNYTQIWRTPLSITRTARKTRLRTGEAYKKMKKEALEIHGIEMEKSFIWGIPTEGTGANGKPERTTGGIINFIKANAAANVNDFTLNTSYTGKDWTDVGGGEEWLDAYLEQLFRFGAAEKLGLCGSGALLGLSKLAKAGAHITMTMKETSYGLKIVEWVTPFGTINLKLHPLMSQEPTTRNSLILLEPSNLKYRYITDTTFYGMAESGNQSPGGVAAAGASGARRDATDEEYLTEAGLELHHPDVFMYLNGLGQDNNL